MAARFASSALKCPACSKSVYAAEEVKGPAGKSWHQMCFCCKVCGKSMRGGEWRDHEGDPHCQTCHGKSFGPKGIGFGSTLGDTGISAPSTTGAESGAKLAEDVNVLTSASVEPSKQEAAKQDAEVATPDTSNVSMKERMAAFQAAVKQDANVATPDTINVSMKERMAAFQAAVGPKKQDTGAPVAKTSGVAARFASAAPKCPVCSKSVYTAEEVKGPGGNSWHALCFCCVDCGKSMRGGQWRESDGKPYCQACHGKSFGPKGIGYGNTLVDTGVSKHVEGTNATDDKPEDVGDVAVPLSERMNAYHSSAAATDHSNKSNGAAKGSGKGAGYSDVDSEAAPAVAVIA